ncbi:MAG: hypothetical protein A3C36_02240 [Omnitrophica WOR_2 bacterium RIFCSPHIGHO2_02_FULL_52_10]|nr:MAG: hypothetical protein A3C36_02240 [Omnitrophica WOR_2 bacterium RIFCSPHIGHO2_02_FULL_52_10]
MNKKIWMGGAVGLMAVLAAVMMLRGKRADVQPVTGEVLSAKQLFVQAEGLKDKGEIIEARQQYQKILSDYPDFPEVEKVQKDLETLNMSLIFSNTEAPDKTVIHEVQTGDTLERVAKKYGTTIDLIKRSNNLSTDVIKVGQKLRIWTGKFNVFVDKSQNLLTLRDGEEILKVYQVSTGEGNVTPIGKFKIESRLIDPVWFNKGLVVPPESPQNVLGTRWLGFDLKGYGIHGTIDPETIGQQVTAGCVRMRNEDVEEIFSIVPIGTEVVIVD